MTSLPLSPSSVVDNDYFVAETDDTNNVGNAKDGNGDDHNEHGEEGGMVLTNDACRQNNDNNHNNRVQTHESNASNITLSRSNHNHTNSNNNSNNNNNSTSTIFGEQLLFFMAGLGSSIGYIASLSSLVYFELLFGPNSFVYLNCAVFLPTLPISLAQAAWDSQFDRLFQSKTSYLFRTIVGYGLIMSGTIGMIFFAYHHQHDVFHPDDNQDKYYSTHGLGWVILNALQQGVGGAILYGELNQLASFVGSLHNINNSDGIMNTDHLTNDGDNELISKILKATVSAGVQASAIVVLAASFGSGFGTMNASKFPIFLSWIVLVEVLCFFASIYLLTGRPRIQASMNRRDTNISMDNLLNFLEGEVMSMSMVGMDNSISSSHSSENNFYHNISNDTNPDAVVGDQKNPTNTQMMRQPFLHHLDETPRPSSLLASTLLRSPSRTRTDPLREHNPIVIQNTQTLRQPILAQTARTRTDPLRSARTRSTILTSSTTKSSSTSFEMTTRELLYHSRYCCLGLALTLIPSFLVGSWFTHVQSEWMLLAQVLFYTRIGCDLIGRFTTILVPPTSLKCVVWTAGLRWIAVVVFFLNASEKIVFPTSTSTSTVVNQDQQQQQQSQRDVLSISLVAFIAFCSGYLVTSCYQLAPQQLVSSHFGMLSANNSHSNNNNNNNDNNTAQQAEMIISANATKQSSILTVAFSISAICGLLLSFLFIAVGV